MHGATEASVTQSFANLPLAGGIDLAELHAALDALINAQLLFRSSEMLVPDDRLAQICSVIDHDAEELLLALILETEMPLWLITATRPGEILRPELIPTEFLSTINSLFPDPERRESFLLARGRLFADEALKALGVAGEEFVVACCRDQLVEAGSPELAPRVRRVSQISDELGYDVTAPRLDGSTRRLEVKATRAVGTSIGFFLTRNEYEVSRRDRDWSLVIVLIGGRDRELLGWLAGEALTSVVPEDQDERAQWQTVRVRVQRSHLTAGLPGVVPVPE